VPLDARERLIVALDVETLDAANALAEKLGNAVRRLKVGLELYTACGPEAVRAVRGHGVNVMLDLKLHDIPATVARATARAAQLGVELLTIHTSGGWKMMEAAADAARKSGTGLKLLGISVLTSMDANDLAQVGEGGAGVTVEDLVKKRAQLAMECGLDGIVASPNEAAVVRAGAPEGFLIVTPGVRPAGGGAKAAAGEAPSGSAGGGDRAPAKVPVDDQKRVATPAAARAAGADYIVVGRPIRDAADPRAAAEAIVAELAGAS
jgi:orotidine-5'-phosphate decarboxylase